MRAPLLALALVLATFGSAVADHAQTSGSRTTSFDHKTGNEWWVEVIVSGSPAKVESRDDGGSWVALEKKSWGAWAKSYHIEPGHRVQFRASWTDGVTIESCWFTHPAGVEECATQPDPDPSGAFAFDHGGGNEWWVEVGVTPKPAAVEAMDTAGAWKALALKDWGEWAASFRIEPGHEVKFRARGSDGVWHESCWFSHPAGAPRCGTQPQPTAWPTEGSYVSFLLDSWDSVPGHSEDDYLWLNYTFTNGAWVGTCEGWSETYTEWDDNQTRERIETFAVTPGPPLGNPKAVQLGQQVNVRLPSCYQAYHETSFVDGQETLEGYHGDEEFLRNGTPVDVGVWTASYEDDGCPCEWRGLSWHPDTGLAIDFVVAYRYSGHSGHLIDTDAKIDTATFPPKPAWPKAGSFVEYRANETDDAEVVVSSRIVRFEYDGSAWSMTCDGRPGEVFDVAPPMGPTTTQAGAMVRPTNAWPCQISPPAVVVQGKYPYWTTKNGQAFRANVWWGDESPDTWGDEDARWDVATGLVLEWEDEGGYDRGDEGYLLDTDAPLARR